jgi:hypothetical protein
MWKYSSHHNVWRAPDYATARHCEIEKMTEVSGRDAGGGCGKDDSLGPWGSRAGRAWVDFAPMSGYNGDATSIKGIDDSMGGVLTGLTLSEDDGALRIRGSLTDVACTIGDKCGEIHLHEGHSCADPGDHYAKDVAGAPGRAPWTTPAPTPEPRDIWKDGGVRARSGPLVAVWRKSTSRCQRNSA